MKPLPREFVARTALPVAAADAFAWHERPGAFLRLHPPWERVEVLRAEGGIRDGARVTVRTGVAGPLAVRWELEHRGYAAGREFRDVLLRGPFSAWEHVHAFHPDGPDRCVLEDRIRWKLPGGRLAAALAGGMVEARLRRIFAYRHAVTQADLETWAAGRQAPRMRVAVTGSSGLIGRALTAFLATQGHEVVRLVRRAPGAGEVRWDPAAGRIDAAALAGVLAVVHLAGENVGEGRWTAARRRAIRDSRVDSTALLARTLAAMSDGPRVLVSGSAIGIYGSRGDEVLTEESGAGEGFLAGVCREWEAATAPAEAAGIRVVHLRTGVVLSPAGGALAKLLPPFRAGLGGPVGDGRGWMSWIALDDVLEVILRALGDDGLRGPVNVVAPGAVTSGQFARTLARVLGRPCALPVPAAVLRLAFGQMAEETVLASARVRPARLEAAGFRFRFSELEPALRHLLGAASHPESKS